MKAWFRSMIQWANVIALLFAAFQTSPVFAAESRFVTVALTTDGTAHVAGDVVGGKQTFPNIVCGTPTTTGFATGVLIPDKDDVNAAFDLYLFNTEPGAIADNAAFDPTDAENENITAVIHLDATNNRFSAVDNGIHTIGSLSVPVQGSGDGTLWGFLVTRSNGTFGASALKLKVSVACD